MKRAILVVLALASALSQAAAGDIATLVNLGFSPDSAYFAFGQYGIDASSGKAYAELYVVDTAKNVFVAGGAKRVVYDSILEPGQDGAGAMYSLVIAQASLLTKYKIDPLMTGRILYLLIDGQEPGESLSFRDFKNGASWTVVLNAQVADIAGKAQSSFSIVVDLVTAKAKASHIIAGNPAIRRDGVSGYIIHGIVIAPDDKTIVAIIEKKLAQKDGASFRSMVETFRIAY